MELTRFDLPPELRQAVEPLLLDALLEYALRHHPGPAGDPVLHLTLTQAHDVLLAQHARWQARLAPAVVGLHLTTDGMPRRVGDFMPALLRCTQEFFRREGAATLRTAAAAETEEARFSVLWTDYFSRCLLDWLRDHDLIGQATHLETADVLVECTKLWIRELAALATDPLPEFNDVERDITVTLERGPVKLRLRGRMEPLILRRLGQGLQVIDFRIGAHGQAEQLVARLLLHLMLVERLRPGTTPASVATGDTGAAGATGRLVCFRSRPARATGADTAPAPEAIAQAFTPFIGNEAAVNKLAARAARARNGKAPPALEHLLICGPVGHGKTFLARCYARALDLPLIEIHSSSITSPALLLDVVNELFQEQSLRPVESRDAQGNTLLIYPPHVLLFDDLHELHRRQAPWFTLLDTPDHRVEAGTRIGIFAQATLIAATQDTGHLPERLLARFQPVELDRYRHEDIARMAAATFQAHQLTLPPALAHLIAVMGRCHPMRAKLFATELRDRHRADPAATPLTREALLHLATHHWHVDEQGLTARDYQYLQALESGPRGLPALQQLLPLKDDEITVHLEPYLLQIGAIRRNSRGRSLTVLGEQILHRHRANRTE